MAIGARTAGATNSAAQAMPRMRWWCSSMLLPAKTTTATPEKRRSGAASAIGRRKPASTATIVVSRTGPKAKIFTKFSVDGVTGARAIAGAGAEPRARPSESERNKHDQAGVREKKQADELEPGSRVAGGGARDAQPLDRRLQSETGTLEKLEVHVDHSGDNGPGDPGLERLRRRATAPARDREQDQHGDENERVCRGDQKTGRRGCERIPNRPGAFPSPRANRTRRWPPKAAWR